AAAPAVVRAARGEGEGSGATGGGAQHHGTARDGHGFSWMTRVRGPHDPCAARPQSAPSGVNCIPSVGNTSVSYRIQSSVRAVVPDGKPWQDRAFRGITVFNGHMTSPDASTAPVDPTTTEAWAALEAHDLELEGSLREWFAEDPERAARF